MQTLTGNILSSDRPYQGQGANVYVGVGRARYRKTRVISGRLTPMRSRFRGTKTARVASQAGSGSLELSVNLPPSLIDNPRAAFDVRPYRDDCECEVEAPQLVAVDSDGDETSHFSGRAVLITVETRVAGSVRLAWRYIRGTGSPTRFRVSRVTGPTSPAAVTIGYGAPGVYEARFNGLSAGAYTFRIVAENANGSVTQTLIDGIAVTPVVAGPAAVTGLSVEVR